MRLIHVVTVPVSLMFLRGQCAYMRAHGVDVTVVSSPGPEVARFAEQEGVGYVEIAMTRAMTPFRDVGSLVRLLRLFARDKPDIVHAHTPKAGLLAMLAARLVGVPRRIFHLHGLPGVTSRGFRRRVALSTTRLTCLCATEVLCVSPSLMAETGKLGLARGRPMSVLGSGTINGIDARWRFSPSRWRQSAIELRRTLHISNDDRVLTFVGRLVRDKGVHDLASAWTTLRRNHEKLVLVLAGEWEKEDPVDVTVFESLANDPRVRVLGFVANPAPIYAASNVLVLPSHREGFGLAAAEAAAMGVPVVGSRITGIVDAVLDGRTGTLVSQRDPNQLVVAIESYLKDPERGRVHGARGRERILADFEPEPLWRMTIELYRRSAPV